MKFELLSFYSLHDGAWALSFGGWSRPCSSAYALFGLRCSGRWRPHINEEDWPRSWYVSLFGREFELYEEKGAGRG